MLWFYYYTHGQFSLTSMKCLTQRCRFDLLVCVDLRRASAHMNSCNRKLSHFSWKKLYKLSFREQSQWTEI